ncbi:MAG: hypothetical protein LBT85_01985 [Bifidobacteriaceae bacterium]|jgi:S-DNA-T family DNA segregation ATPase FtsK/SpoIIIE|nr:hypothetical protein [Bifidobacteriaceae bacterium]
MTKKYFTPSPHNFTRFKKVQITLPKFSINSQKIRFPIVASFAPLVLGLAMFLINPNPMSIVFMALSPAIVVANFIDTKVGTRRKTKNLKKLTYQKIDLINRQISEYKSQEVSIRNKQYPSIAEIINSVISLNSLVWSRDVCDEEFLSLRLGAGQTNSSIELINLDQTDICDFEEMEMEDKAKIDNLLQNSKILSNAPLVYFFNNNSTSNVEKKLNKVNDALGVIGNFTSIYPFICSFVLQFCALQRPRDLKISYVADKTIQNYLKFIEYLPHYISFNNLENINNETCIIFCFDNFKYSISAAENNENIYLLCFSDVRKNLPSICKTILDLTDDTISFVKNYRKEHIDFYDYFDYNNYCLALKTLCAIADPLAKNIFSNLPKNLLFSQFEKDHLKNKYLSYKHTNYSALSSQERKEYFHNYKLETSIGVSASGSVNISLIENGPHCLIGGTTGCGKSEFIKSWILSLSLVTPVSDVNFLLIDYKGGSAFGAISKIPHCVGLVTDLSPKLFQRTQISLKAELKRREKIFLEAGVKDLKDMQKKFPDRAPSSLIIIVDELAALVNDIPNFLDELIDIAARGRSLGLHLILATQRPSGVIKDNLRANTNLRIALRVADEADSNDIIGQKTAAHFSSDIQGRCAAKYTNKEIIQFQSPFIDNDIFLNEKILFIKNSYLKTESKKPYKPWLEELPNSITLQDDILENQKDFDSLALVDVPDKQKRDFFNYSPQSDGNLIIYGSFGSGKTSFLETLIYRKSFCYLQEPFARPSFYIIGSEANFCELQKFATVGNAVDLSDEEMVERILDYIINKTKTLNKFKINQNKTNQKSTIDKTENIYLIIDDWQLFRETYDSTLDNNVMKKFEYLVSVSRSAGIAIIITTDRANCVQSKILSSFAANIFMKLISDQDCLLLGLDKDIFNENFPPGRCFYKGDEMQIFIIEKDFEKRIQKIKKLSNNLSQFYEQNKIPKTRRLERLPPIIEYELIKTKKPLSEKPLSEKPLSEKSLSERLLSGKPFLSNSSFNSLNKTILGLKYSDLSVFEIELKGLIVISGTENSGKTNLVNLIKEQNSNIEVIENIINQNDEKQIEKYINKIQQFKKLNMPLIVEMSESNNPNLWQLISLLKTADISIVLQPESAVSETFSYLPMPKCVRSDFCQGRGIVFHKGKAQIVQIAKLKV